MMMTLVLLMKMTKIMRADGAYLFPYDQVDNVTGHVCLQTTLSFFPPRASTNKQPTNTKENCETYSTSNLEKVDA